MNTLVKDNPKPILGGWRKFLGTLLLFICIHLTSCKAAISLAINAL